MLNRFRLWLVEVINDSIVSFGHSLRLDGEFRVVGLNSNVIEIL